MECLAFTLNIVQFGVIAIRQILHRAPLLMLLFAAVAAMIALCFSTIAEFYTMEAVLPDFISDSSVSIEISQASEGESLVKTKDLLKYCTAQDTALILYRNYPVSNGKAVLLCGDTAFKPELAEGRNFSPEDFEQQAPVALISEEVRDRCRDSDGELYFVHENSEYRVIGIFKRQTSRGYTTWGDKSGALYFVNMEAATGFNLDTPLNGSYSLDAKGKSMDLFAELAHYAGQINPQIDIKAYTNKSSTSQNIMESLRKTLVVIMAFVLTAVLVLLNVFSTTYYWIEGRYKELAVRMLSGSRLPRIRRMVLRDYLLLVTIGFAFGLLAAALVIKSGIFPFIGETVHWAAVIAGYLLCLAMGTLAGWISLSLRLKQEIIAQVRG